MAIQVIKDTPGNILWTTDKAEINAESVNVTYQVSLTQTTWINTSGITANTSMPTGNLYANAISVPNGTTHQLYVGAGNYLIITGNNFTAVALGSRTSATVGVYGSTST
jgi:hypothetical protein